MSSISVIIPAHNAMRFLASAVESVQAQTFTDWELTIVDDGSTDNTLAIAEQFSKRDSRIRFLHQSQRGLSGARNAGIDNTTGEYIQLLDADDMLLPHKLETHVAHLTRHPECSIVYGRGEYFDENGPLNIRVPFPLYTFLTELLTNNVMLVNAALVRRRVFDQIGNFKEKSSCRYPIYGCEDWDLWLRAAMAGLKIEFLKNLVVKNRWHADNMSRQKTLMKRSSLWVLEEAALLRHQLPAHLRILLRMQLFYRRCDYIVELFRSGDDEEALRECALVKQDCPYGPETTITGWMRFSWYFLKTTTIAGVLVSCFARLIGRWHTIPRKLLSLTNSN